MNKLVLFLILCHYVTLSAIAQDNTGAINGVVVNADGKPAAAASVQLTAKQITVTTNEQGNFTISNLQPGSYELVITLIGHAPATQTVKVAAGKTTRLTISLKLANAALRDVVVTEPMALPHQQPAKHAFTK
jgi:iron complex outermembrane receptor protein